MPRRMRTPHAPHHTHTQLVPLTHLPTPAHLVCEGAGHDKGGVASGAAEVQQATLGEDDDSVAVGEDEAVTLGLDGLYGCVCMCVCGGTREAFQCGFRHKAGWPAEACLRPARPS